MPVTIALKLSWRPCRGLDQLDIRHSGHLHHRYFWPPQPPAHYFSSNGIVSPVYRALAFPRSRSVSLCHDGFVPDLFMAVYSPGEGPVPFTYSAEAFPLHIRDIDMSSSTAITWGFNFITSFSWPSLREAHGNTGAFCWYAAWNFLGWVFAYFFLPETRNLMLEELDSVFSMKNREHGGYCLRKLPWYSNKHFLGRDVAPFPPLYQFAKHQSLPNDKTESVTHYKVAPSNPAPI
ncbi:plastidic glucose transporter 4 [Metarhizium acridum CQMa 102]|uniref:Plastidic glucose transporter 4 n=1 Tax=Metarhizium acridum (strain CQMa 102) TaxID=655827 RepID=E9DVT1_METAQ|nr:plastidic glucose transporter 4 [Metarhizium acridum CQMa 102]EFY92128.1 plastidic glucose transporter 4 [Metarhizium acridum CQMa 102]